MLEENNYLTSSNNVFIEVSSKNRDNNLENLLNPDTNVNIN